MILCGGQSRRMGRPKEMLPFGQEVMLARVVRRLREAVDPVVVVAGPQQPLPELPAAIHLLRDRHEDRGPLEGLAVGLAALRGRAEAAYVTGCDVPLLNPPFVRRMIELLTEHDIAVPHVDGFDQPLAAVYRVHILPQVESLLAGDRQRPALLFGQCDTRRVTREELVEVDPQLHSLANVNTPADYRAALAEAGLHGPQMKAPGKPS
jgi:molybdopterin-guanine dinucleotide biosynthesis protein A